jgi:hypothetical protein
MRHWTGMRQIGFGRREHEPIAQVLKPELMSAFDPMRDRSLRSRLWALDFAADHETIWFSAHFPESSAGRVTRGTEGCDWHFG